MQSEPRGITAALLCLHMKSETAGRGREGVSVSIRCVQITRYVWRAWCAATIQITHSTLSQLHADGMWIGREGEERVAAYSFPPSHIQLAHTTPHLISFPFLLHLICLSSPTTHSHTIISTDLADNHLHITATLTHTSQSSPNACASAQGNAAAAAAASPLAFITTSSPRPPPPACHTCKHKQQVVHV